VVEEGSRRGGKEGGGRTEAAAANGEGEYSAGKEELAVDKTRRMAEGGRHFGKADRAPDLTTDGVGGKPCLMGEGDWK